MELLALLDKVVDPNGSTIQKFAAVYPIESGVVVKFDNMQASMQVWVEGPEWDGASDCAVISSADARSLIRLARSSEVVLSESGTSLRVHSDRTGVKFVVPLADIGTEHYPLIHGVPADFNNKLPGTIPPRATKSSSVTVWGGFVQLVDTVNRSVIFPLDGGLASLTGFEMSASTWNKLVWTTAGCREVAYAYDFQTASIFLAVKLGEYKALIRLPTGKPVSAIGWNLQNPLGKPIPEGELSLSDSSVLLSPLLDMMGVTKAPAVILEWTPDRCIMVIRSVGIDYSVKIDLQQYCLTAGRAWKSPPAPTPGLVRSLKELKGQAFYMSCLRGGLHLWQPKGIGIRLPFRITQS